jgi:3'-5' exoribonuclease
VGQGVEVTGTVGEYRGHPQLNVDRIDPAQITDVARFQPVATRPLDEMRAEFDGIRDSIENLDLDLLLTALFDDPDAYERFTTAPAAKRNHHACVGGLLEHTLAVTRYVLTACRMVTEIHRDLAVTAALLHDLGKVDSYDPVSFDLTEQGRLWSHLYMGASRVEHVIDTLPGFDPELRKRLVHAILAHHGRLEHGSPVLPMTLEAILVQNADHLDSDVRGALDHLERTRGGGETFTEPSFMHDTRLYRGIEENAEGDIL